MVADELRRQADQFIDLAELEEKICRDPATRPVRTARDPSDVRAPAGRRTVHHAPAAATLSYPDDEEESH
jgi:hypothetical protein